MVHLEVVGVHIRLNGGGDRPRAPHVVLGCNLAIATSSQHESSQDKDSPQECAIHWMTSRPTAMFIWAAALRYDPTRFKYASLVSRYDFSASRKSSSDA